MKNKKDVVIIEKHFSKYKYCRYAVYSNSWSQDWFMLDHDQKEVKVHLTKGALHHYGLEDTNYEGYVAFFNIKVPKKNNEENKMTKFKIGDTLYFIEADLEIAKFTVEEITIRKDVVYYTGDTLFNYQECDVFSSYQDALKEVIYRCNCKIHETQEILNNLDDIKENKNGNN